MLKTEIRALRLARGMDQAELAALVGVRRETIGRLELAALVGVRRETIGRLEKGQYNPSLKLAMDIAKVFDRTVEEVFSFQEE